MDNNAKKLLIIDDDDDLRARLGPDAPQLSRLVPEIGQRVAGLVGQRGQRQDDGFFVHVFDYTRILEIWLSFVKVCPWRGLNCPHPNDLHAE